MTVPITFTAEDASIPAATSRMLAMTTQEMDALIFAAKQNSDEATAWLLDHTLVPRIARMIAEYRVNIVFGFVPKDECLRGLETFLRNCMFAEYMGNRMGSTRFPLVQSWSMQSSHFTITFYNGREVKIPVQDVARILLKPFEQAPDPLALFTAVVRHQYRTADDALRKSGVPSLQLRVLMETRQVMRAALGLLMRHGVTIRED